MKTIEQVLVLNHINPREGQGLELYDALMRREDEIADTLRFAGVQFGLHPEIVAEVLVATGVGTPPAPEVKAMIHQQFVNLMDRLREEHEDGNDN